MKYYKLGDYWYKGAPIFYDLLDKHSIVICGYRQMCKGDIVAIAEGHTIFAVAQLSSNSYQANTRLELRDEFSKYDIPFDDNYIANAKIYKLNSNITYQLQQGICEIHNPDVISKLNNEISKIMSTELVSKCKTILENNHNLILTGAPGTGKTYLAKEIAKAMGCTDDEIGFVQFHPSYDYTDFVEGLRPIQDDNGTVGFKRKDGVFKEFCKKALKINDIDSAIEWFKNEIKNRGGSITIDKTNRGSSVNYQIKNSPNDSDNFMVLTNTNSCPPTGYPASIKDIKSYMATGNYDKNHDTYQPTIGEYIKTHFFNKPFVFIIDEINRGEISKIFGELFFSIDPGYRGEKGKTNTQYQNLIPKEGDSNYSLEKADVFRYGFYVPENVYIIGTMNDIDRSVESMDFAFRRRFAFKEIKANENIGMLDELGDVKDEAKNRMFALNKAISDIPGLNSAYHIGGAYFLKLKNYDNNFNELWDNHLDGLLREYLRGRRQEEIEEKMKILKQAYETSN